MKFSSIRTVVATIFLLGVAQLLAGCEQTCSVPMQQPASVRILNAIPDVKTLHVYIDGKLFDEAHYDLSNYPSITNSDSTIYAFGYQTQYRSDLTSLPVGLHRILAFADVARRDTLVDTTMLLSDHRQTLLFIGRHATNRLLSTPPQLLYLDDNARSKDENRTLGRFIHAVSDLSGIDVYFSKSVKRDAGGRPKPDLTIHYSEISTTGGTGGGTGRLSTDYLDIPTEHNDGLLITSAGDTSNILVLIDKSFTHSGFFATVVVRGESNPVDHEPIISSLVLEDGSESQGTFNFSTETFAVRLVNGLRDSNLSALIWGKLETSFRADAPLQKNVTGVAPSSVSKYWPLTPFGHGDARYVFTTDSAHIFDWTYYIGDTLHLVAEKDRRYSIMVIDHNKLGSPKSDYEIFTIVDTLSLPTSASFGRVRIVNLSADHKANFTLGGTSFSLAQKDVGVVDVPNGPQSFTISDGSASSTVSYTQIQGQPVTIFIMPAKPGKEFPYVVQGN